MAKDKKIPVKDNESGSSEIVRKFKQSPGIYIGSVFILILVTVAFVGGDFLTGLGGAAVGGDLTFGYYDKAPVSYVPGNILAQNYNQAARYYQSQGFDVNNFWVGLQIWKQAYRVAVTHTAILQIMKRSNYTVPGKSVDRQVAQLPEFMDENGRFSSFLYRQMPESERLALWRQVQESMAVIVYNDDLFQGRQISSGEKKFIANMASVMRSFDVVSFNVEEYPESEYLSYARQRERLFGTIHLSKITVNSSEREARKILDSVLSGASAFEDAARAQSSDTYADRGGDMGSRYFYELEREVPDSAHRDAIAGLNRGEITDIFRIGDSWVFFRAEEALKPADFNDETVMEKVRDYIRNFDRGLMEDWAIAKAKVFISEAENDGFENAVRWNNFQKSSMGPVPLNYGGVDLFTPLESLTVEGFTPDELSGLSSNENFWKIAFSTPLNTPCEPLVQGSRVLVLLPIEQTTAEEDYLENLVNMYSSYWLNLIGEQSIPFYFLMNPRMDDRFDDTYIKFFSPSN
jgi:hypothetical protein